MKRITPAGICLAVVTTIGALVWDLHVPLSIDDWSYLTIPLGDNPGSFWYCAGPVIESFSDILTAIREHFFLINGRLANIVAFLFAFDHTTYQIVCGLFIGLWSILMAMAGDIKSRLTGASAAIATVAMWTLFPWYNFFQSTVFQTNYVWTSAMICGLMILLPRLATMSRAGYAATCLLAFLTGAMHEGFSVVFIVYLAAGPVFERGMYCRRYAGVVFFTAAALLITLTGGVLGRIEGQKEIFDYSVIGTVLSRIAFSLMPFLLAVVCTALLWWKRRLSLRDICKRFGALYAAAIVGAAMPVVLMLFDRVFWPMDLFCALIIINCLTDFCASVPRRAGRAMTLVFGVLYTFWLAALCRYEIIIDREWHREMAMLEPVRTEGAPFSGLFHIDVIRNDEIPWWLLDIVQQPLEKHLTAERFASFHGDHRGTTLPADPAYARLPIDEWPQVPGDTNLRGRWPFIATTDTTFHHYVAVFGAPDANMPPVDRLLSRLSGKGDTVEHTFIWWPITVHTTEDSITRVYVRELPRTLRHRPLIEIRKGDIQ